MFFEAVGLNKWFEFHWGRELSALWHFERLAHSHSLWGKTCSQDTDNHHHSPPQKKIWDGKHSCGKKPHKSLNNFNWVYISKILWNIVQHESIVQKHGLVDALWAKKAIWFGTKCKIAQIVTVNCSLSMCMEQIDNHIDMSGKIDVEWSRLPSQWLWSVLPWLYPGQCVIFSGDYSTAIPPWKNVDEARWPITSSLYWQFTWPTSTGPPQL